MKKIFITGGAGYVGSFLSEFLAEKGHQIIIYDAMFFTEKFINKTNPNIKVIKGDIRNIGLLKDSCKNCDIFIHLACISNDVSFELDEALSTSINLEAFEPMVLAAKENKVKRFIYASTSSVYGLSKKKDVKEEHELVPITLYNKYKAMCEPILFKHTNKNFVGTIFRPATVCGVAPRMRFDLSVNILTNYAINKNYINVFGGEQMRPNIHIKDYCRVVELLIESETQKISNQIFNAGNQNLKMIEIANIVKDVVKKNINNKENLKIIKTPSNDIRSYHINSDKIKNILGFTPNFSIKDAVKDICDAFKEKKFVNTFDDDIFFNVKRLQKLKII